MKKMIAPLSILVLSNFAQAEKFPSIQSSIAGRESGTIVAVECHTSSAPASGIFQADRDNNPDIRIKVKSLEFGRADTDRVTAMTLEVRWRESDDKPHSADFDINLADVGPQEVTLGGNSRRGSLLQMKIPRSSSQSLEQIEEFKIYVVRDGKIVQINPLEKDDLVCKLGFAG